jgi:hypothetical protein
MTDSAKHTVQAGTVVLIGEPAIEPVALLAAIAAATDRLPAVRSLSRCWARSGQEAPGLIVGVDLDPDDNQGRAAVVDAVSEAVSSAHPEFTVDVVFWADGATFVEWMQQNVKPFHEHAG